MCAPNTCLIQLKRYPSMLFQFLVVVQALVGAAMIGVILMQKSEGGGLGVGGSPSGLMSARGAADLLTRSTGVLAFLFVVLSIALAGLASVNHSTGQIGDALTAQPPVTDVGAGGGVPLDGGIPQGGDPLAQAAKDSGTAKPAAPAKDNGVPVE